MLRKGILTLAMLLPKTNSRTFSPNPWIKPILLVCGGVGCLLSFLSWVFGASLVLYLYHFCTKHGRIVTCS
uniref:Uncharacterized protein n=1 Tax=Setaria viridis TaxID=4556 RepID=A0A4U6V313_SETVI|nr:hypothetical protein SEVIR_4G289403v2 [Setaria viridis]